MNEYFMGFLGRSKDLEYGKYLIFFVCVIYTTLVRE
jgi:hypothetical protein